MAPNGRILFIRNRRWWAWCLWITWLALVVLFGQTAIASVWEHERQAAVASGLIVLALLLVGTFWWRRGRSSKIRPLMDSGEATREVTPTAHEGTAASGPKPSEATDSE